MIISRNQRSLVRGSFSRRRRGTLAERGGRSAPVLLSWLWPGEGTVDAIVLRAQMQPFAWPLGFDDFPSAADQTKKARHSAVPGLNHLAKDQLAAGNFRRFIGLQIEAIQLHDFGPCCNKVFDELRLSIITGVRLCDRSQL